MAVLMVLLIAEGFEHIRGTLDYERRFVESSPSGVPASLTQIAGRFPGSKCLRAVNGQVFSLRTHAISPGSITAILSFHFRSKGSFTSGLIIGLLNAANAQQIVVETLNLGGLQQINLRRGATVLYASPNLPIDAFYHVELRVKISPIIGEWDLRINEMSVSTGTGNTANGGTAGFVRLFASLTSDVGAAVYIDLDDLILMDDSGNRPHNRMLGITGIESLVSKSFMTSSLEPWKPNTGTNEAAIDDASTGTADDDTTFVDNSPLEVVGDFYDTEEVTSLHSSALNLRLSVDARETSTASDILMTSYSHNGKVVDLGQLTIGNSASYSRYKTDSVGGTPEDISSTSFGFRDTGASGGISLP